MLVGSVSFHLAEALLSIYTLMVLTLATGAGAKAEAEATEARTVTAANFMVQQQDGSRRKVGLLEVFTIVYGNTGTFSTRDLLFAYVGTRDMFPGFFLD